MFQSNRFTGAAALLNAGWTNQSGSLAERDSKFPTELWSTDSMEAATYWSVDATPLERVAILGRYAIYKYSTDDPDPSPGFQSRPSEDFLIFHFRGTGSNMIAYDRIESWLGESTIFSSLDAALNIALEINIRDYSQDLKSRLYQP
jgi:hypothetical protein